MIISQCKEDFIFFMPNINYYLFHFFLWYTTFVFLIAVIKYVNHEENILKKAAVQLPVKWEWGKNTLTLKTARLTSQRGHYSLITSCSSAVDSLEMHSLSNLREKKREREREGKRERERERFREGGERDGERRWREEREREWERERERGERDVERERDEREIERESLTMELMAFLHWGSYHLRAHQIQRGLNELLDWSISCRREWEKSRREKWKLYSKIRLRPHTSLSRFSIQAASILSLAFPTLPPGALIKKINETIT